MLSTKDNNAKCAQDECVELSVVILSYNRLSCIRKHIVDLLQAQKLLGFELIVVDNNSSDGSVEFLIDLSATNPSMQLILNPDNFGVARGRNCGFSIAQGEFVVYLDDDAEISISDLGKIPVIFSQNPYAGILAFRIFDPPRQSYLNDFGEANTPIANFAGAAHAFKRCVFENVGLLDEACRFGGEELDMSIRAFNHGYMTRYTPEITVMHHSIQRSSEVKISRRVEWVYNFVRIFFKHFPGWVAVKLSLRFSLSHVFGAYRGWGLNGAVSILRSILIGYKDGRKAHSCVTGNTVQFYRSKTLQPEFGNVPLFMKLLKRFT